MLSATKQKLKKRTSPAKKISRISNTLRPLHRKKLTALNLRLRREARLLRFRCRQRYMLWKSARPYLRADASVSLRNKRSYLYNVRSTRKRVIKRLSLAYSALRQLLRRRGVSRRSFKARVRLAKRITTTSSLLGAQYVISTARAAISASSQRFKTKITDTLLRRRQRRYKKLTFLFLKAHRLNWLRKSHPVRQGKLQSCKSRPIPRKTKQVNRPAPRKVVVKMAAPFRRSEKTKATNTKKGVASSAITPAKIHSLRKGLPPARKSIFWVRRRIAVKRERRLQQIKKALARSIFRARRRPGIRSTLLCRAKLLRRVCRPDRAHSIVRRRRKKLKIRKLKIRRGRRTKLLLRRKHYHRSRKLRRVAGKRVTVRNRRAFLLTKSQPVRRHLYYKRLLLTQRVGVAIQQLRGLRDTRPQDIRCQQLRHSSAIARSWRSELVWLVAATSHHPLSSNRESEVAKLKRLATALVKKGRVPGPTRRGLATRAKKNLFAPVKKELIAPTKRLQTAPVKTPNERRHHSGRRARAAVKKRKRTAVRGKKHPATLKSRKVPLFGPRTHMQALVREAAADLHLINKYKKLLATTKYKIRHLYRTTPQLARQEYGAARQLPLQPVTRRFSRVTVQRKSKKKVTSDKTAAIRTALSHAALKLRKVRTHRISARRTHRRSLPAIKKSIWRYGRSLIIARKLIGPAKKLPVQRKQAAPLREVTPNERQRLRTTLAWRTLAGRQPLIHRYNLVSRLPRTHLYDPQPRVLYAIGRTFIRKSLRYKRRLAKRARTVAPKSKRKLRRRIRKKVVALRKRTYSYTDRSPVHTGRVVPWKTRAEHRGQLYSRLISTRRTFKKLLRTQLITGQLSAVPAFHQKRAEQVGRTLLWALLRLTATVPGSDKGATVVSRLRTVIRLFLRRRALPTAPAIRLLILKAFALLPTERRAQKKQLLALEHLWLLTCNPCSVVHVRKVIGARIRLKSRVRSSRRHMSQLKQRNTRKSLPVALLHRRVFALPRRMLRKTKRFTRAYSKKVKRLLRKRPFATLIRGLRLMRGHSKKWRTQARKKLAATCRSWRRVHRYRKARQLTIRLVSRRLRTRIRRGERCAIHFRSRRVRRNSTTRKLHRQPRSALRPARAKLKLRNTFRLKRSSRTSQKRPSAAGVFRGRSLPHKQLLPTPSTKQRVRNFKINFRRTAFLQQHSLLNKTAQPLTRIANQQLSARLNSARLRAKKALLWKAPLRPTPVSVISIEEHRQAKNWYSPIVASQRAWLKLGQQQLRRLLRAPGSTLPAHHWSTTRLNHRYSISEVSRGVVKRSTLAPAYKKFQPQGRLSKIGRIAVRPRITPPWITCRPEYKNRQRAKRARVFRLSEIRIRALRSRPFRRTLFFRKNRLFMRRRATHGLKELPKGKLLQLPGFPLTAIRPLKVRLRRSKPLRRSLRLQLVLRCKYKGKPRFKTIQASTGRVFSTLRPFHRRGRRYWRRLANRKRHVVTNRKLQIVNQLLKQFDRLSGANPLVIRPTDKVTNAAARVRYKKAISPLRLLLCAHRHSIAARRRRTKIKIRRTVMVRKMFTLSSGRPISIPINRRITTGRHRVMFPEFTTIQRGSFGRKVPLSWQRLRRSKLLRNFRNVVRVSRSGRRSHGVTPGKIDRLIRLERQRRYLPFRTPRGQVLLRPVGNRRWFHISLTRVGLFGGMTCCPTRKPGVLKVCRKLVLVKTRGKRIFNLTKYRVRAAQLKFAKNEKLLRARAAKAWAQKRITILKSRRDRKAASRNRWNLHRPVAMATRPTSKLKTKANAVNSSKAEPVTGARTSRSAAIKPAQVTKFTPPTKQQANTTISISEPVLSPQLAKKITAFNKEANAQTEKAYNAIMSGLKASWTQLQDTVSLMSLKQRETDVEIMEKLYIKHYGPIVRFNSKGVLDFKRYKAAQAVTTPVTTQKK